MLVTTLLRLTGYAQEANVHTVTDKTDETGYGIGRRPRMALLIAIALPLALFAALAIAAQLWGVDSRPGLGDDHAR